MELIEVSSVIQRIWTSNSHYKMEKQGAAILQIQLPPTFIQPKLRTIENNDGSFMIISAPGAVGKTTFAKYCTHHKKAYYWDLSQISLGDNTFIGTIADYFGALQLSKVIEDLNKGNVSFFFDAFDEAEIISGWERVEKFVREIYSHAKGLDRPNVIFFSRTETADLLQLLLEELGGSSCYSMYEIDYFVKEGAENFIKTSLKHQNDDNPQRHPIPFTEALKNIFATIGKGINHQVADVWSDAEIRSFIGYSPVLQTIASFLRGQNYGDIANEYGGKHSQIEGFKVIKKFIEDLLAREQDKVISGIRQKIHTKAEERKWDQWRTLYTPLDQIKYIISYITGKRDLTFLYDKVDHETWLLDDYVDSLTQFLPNHPFLRDARFSSPAFRDYSLGILLRDPEYDPVCKRLLGKGDFVLTPLFSFFYALVNNNQCVGDHVGYLYESAFSKMGQAENNLLTFIKGKNPNYSLEIVNPDGSNINNLEFSCIINQDHPLTFKRKIHNVTVMIDQKLILGRSEGSLELSEVEIHAEEILLKTRECILNCHRDSSIVLKTNKFDQENPALRLIKKGDGPVYIHWPHGRIHPWVDYFSEINLHQTEDYEDELYALKILLKPFRRHRKGDFGKQYEFIDKVIIKHSEPRKQMCDYLLSLQVLDRRPAERMYFLDESRLNEYGISWSSLSSLSINPDAKRFLDSFRKRIQ